MIKKNNNFEIQFTNIRGIKSNFNSIETHLASTRPALLCLVEVQASCLGNDNDYQCTGYSRVDYLVPHRGIILYLRNDVSFALPNFPNLTPNPGFNILWVEIKIRSHSIFVCSLYRSPNLSYAETSYKFDELSNTIEQIYSSTPSAEIVVLGDFNVHNNTWLGFSHGRDQSGEAAELFSNINLLTQLVNKPTRYPDRSGQSPHLLDLFLTTMPDKYTIDVSAPLGLSDHALVSAKFPIVPTAISPLPSRRIWHFNNADWDGLNNFFSSINWASCFVNKNADKAAKGITSLILEGIKKYIPSSLKKPIQDKRQWFNRKCRNAISIKKAAHRKYLEEPTEDNLANFKLARNKANSEINKAKIEHDRKMRDRIRKVLDNNTNVRTFWSFASLVKRNFNGKTSSVPTLFCNNTSYDTPTLKANLLASQFSLSSNLPTLNQKPPILPSVTTSMSKVNFRFRVVSKVLSKLNPNKATGPDGIPSIVLKKCHRSLAKPLSKLFHLSMKTGVFPTIWKTANIQPVPKAGDKSSPSNYRPIALLSVLSKVMETIVNFNIVKYLEANSLLSDYQYGFRKNRSSGDLIAYLVNKWEHSVEKFGESGVVSLDISKAFDRVWHDCLISKIRSLNLHGLVVEWLVSYLSNRKIRVVLDGAISDLYEINAGVPQGSSLSPTLFLIYINDLLTSMAGSIHSFADDTTLSASIEFANQKDCNTQLESSRSQMNDTILRKTNMILEWGRLNRVEFNPNKFQACLFSHKRAQTFNTPVINGAAIKQCSSIKMLGLNISSDLSWKDHIYSISKKAAQCLGFIRRCKFYFQPDEVVKLYKSYVRPIMEYNSFVWGGAPKTHLSCLNKIQNRVIQIINDKTITSTLDSLEHRRNVSALTTFYKYYFGNCSLEISSLVPPPHVGTANTRFNSKQHKFAVKISTSRTCQFQSSFFPRVASLWNQVDESTFPCRFNPQSFRRRLHHQMKKEEGQL